LDVIEATCYRGLMSVYASPASIYRAIAAAGPQSLTLLVDEADSLFGSKKSAEDNEDLRGLINAGHQRNRKVPRWNAQARCLEMLETFAFVALAGIGDMPDTIEDRAVIAVMRRRARDETVAAFRQRRDGVQLRNLGEQLTKVISGHVYQLRDAEPDMPVEDRAADTWEPLVALADAAGGDWPTRARDAARAFTEGGESTRQDSLGVRLLADLREIFGDHRALPTERILSALAGLEEAPWKGLGGGLDARGLANLLRRYGVASKTLRVGEATPKGYTAESLADLWARYLPRIGGGSATSATSATSPGIVPVTSANDVADGESPIRNGSATRAEGAPSDQDPSAPCCGRVADGVADRKPVLTSNVADVADVAGPPRCGCPNGSHGIHGPTCTAATL
jgi:hypothetical protein